MQQVSPDKTPIIVGGVPVQPLTTAEWVERLLRDARDVRETGAGPKFHTTVNGNVLSHFGSNPKFREALGRADAIAADGMSVIFGAKIFAGRTIPDRAATTDLFHDLVRACEANGMSIYMLGAKAEINAAAVRRVRELYPNLRIAGHRDGYFEAKEEEAVIASIMATKPDLVWVGLGCPRQEQFVARNLEKFQGATWVKTCGGLYDFLSGANRRAPMWMQKIGMEWAFRVCLEPRRLLWRYITTNIYAIYRMIVASRRAA